MKKRYISISYEELAWILEELNKFPFFEEIRKITVFLVNKIPVEP